MNDQHQQFPQHEASVVTYIKQAPFTKVVELTLSGRAWTSSRIECIRDAYPGFLAELKGVQRAYLASGSIRKKTARLQFPDERSEPVPARIADCLMVDRDGDQSILLLLGSDQPLPRLLMAKPRPVGALLWVRSIPKFTRRAEWVERFTGRFADVLAYRGEVVPDALLALSMQQSYEPEVPATLEALFA